MEISFNLNFWVDVCLTKWHPLDTKALSAAAFPAAALSAAAAITDRPAVGSPCPRHR